MSESISLVAGIDAGDNRLSLGDLVRKLNKGILQLPYFQRGYVWPKQSALGYIETILTGRRVRLGTISTYQVPDDPLIYLCDGMQRLTTAKRFIQKPADFQLSITSDEAVDACDAYYVTLQHNLLSSHDEGLWAFQVLNMGTTIVPAEFYKGELVRFPQGALVYNEAPRIVESASKHLGAYTSARVQRYIMQRDALALFYQYVSRTTETDFWNVAASTVRKNQRVVETVLADFVQACSEKEIEKLLGDFDVFIRQQTALVTQSCRDVGMPEGMAVNQTLFRWMLHTAIWRKNSDKSEQLQRRLFSGILDEMWKRYGKTVSRVEVEGPGGKTEQIRFTTARIASTLPAVCRVFDVPLYEGVRRRNGTAVGYSTTK